MVEQWVRIIANATADQNSSDTTETPIGTTGVKVPTWARSVVQAAFSLGTITMTTAEDVAGYFRIYDDNNNIEPLYFPMPVIPANLAGAAAGQMHTPITVPVLQPVVANEILRMAAAFDAATTGVHLFGGYFLFSDQPVGRRIHCQKMAATAIGDALAESGEVSIETLDTKTSKLLGIIAYHNQAGTSVAAEGTEPYLRVKSRLSGWQEQQLPLNIINASLGADSYAFTKPVCYLYKDVWNLKEYFDGFHHRILGLQSVNVRGKETFTFSAQNNRDVNDNIDSIFRAFLLWQE